MSLSAILTAHVTTSVVEWNTSIIDDVILQGDNMYLSAFQNYHIPREIFLSLKNLPTVVQCRFSAGKIASMEPIFDLPVAGINHSHLPIVVEPIKAQNNSDLYIVVEPIEAQNSSDLPIVVEAIEAETNIEILIAVDAQNEGQIWHAVNIVF